MNKKEIKQNKQFRCGSINEQMENFNMALLYCNNFREIMKKDQKKGKNPLISYTLLKTNVSFCVYSFILKIVIKELKTSNS